MSKINNIEINDFRIYEGKQVFDLSSTEGPSNLVVLYAPNGYGKTSFFDAVEWAYSNKIKRFESQIIKNEISSKDYANDDQILLTHRKSHLQGKSGQIKITTEDGKSFQRTVKARGINNNPGVKFDYRPGEYSGDFTEEELYNLPETNILTQDQIDSFLRFKTPEEKFNALKEFWPEGEEATKTYGNLTYFKKVVGNNLHDVQNEISFLEEQMEKLLNTEENLIATNSAIEKLRENSSVDFNIDPVNNTINQEVYNSIIKASETFRKKIEAIINNVDQLLLRINEIKIKFPKYISDIKNKEVLSTDLIKHDELSKFHVDHQQIVKSISRYNETILTLTDLVSDYENLSKNFDEFQKLQTSITALQKEGQELLILNKSLINKIDIFNSSSQNLRSTFQDRKANCSDLEKKFEEIDEKYQQLVDWNLIIGKSSKELTTISTSLLENQKNLQQPLDRKNQLESARDTRDVNKLSEQDKEKIKDLIDLINKKLLEIENAEKEIKLKGNEYEQSGTFNENLNRIITWGETYVADLQTSSCPLCKTEFEDVNHLINAIKTDKPEILKLNVIEEELTQLRKNRDKLHEELTKLEITFLDFVQSEIQICDRLIIGFQSDKNRLSSEKLDVENKLKRAKENKDAVLNFFRQIDVDENLLKEDELAQLKNGMVLSIEKNKNDMIKLENLIQKKQSYIVETENMLAVLKNKVIANTNEAELIKHDEMFRLMQSIFSKLKIPANSSKLKLDSDLKEFSEQLFENKLKSDENKEKALDLLNKIQQHSLKLEYEEIAGYKVNLDNDLKQNEKDRIDFEDLYKQYIGEVFEQKKIDDAYENAKKQKTKLQQEQTDIINLGIHLEVIKENVQRSEIEKTLTTLKKKLPQIIAADAKLSDAKISCIDYIDSGINNYFNKDIINQIYSRIEPHPNLTEIDFKPEVTDRGPRLIIKAKGEDDEVNPVLYLSAGQVNILSLSIFLAKAFEMGSDTISTIFLDDPVQNLSDINILSFIDLLRTVITHHDKQIILSTHDEKFFKLLQNKISPDYFRAKYFELETFGKVKDPSVN